MRLALLIAGAVAVLLGGLWLLQGLGIVRLEPVLCVAECVPIAAPSILWSVTGLAFVVAGAVAVFHAVRGTLRR